MTTKRKGGWLKSGVRFANLGLLSFLLVLGITAAGHELAGLPAEVSYLVALVAAFVVNYLGARWYVYRSFHVPIGKQATLFLGSTLAFRGGEFVGFMVLNNVLGVYYLLTVGLVMVASFVVKFLFFGRFVFTQQDKEESSAGE